MNLCFISREYPPFSHTGGIGTYTYIVSSELAQRGHRVHVICCGIEEQHEETKNRVIVHRIPIYPFLLPQGRYWYPWRVIARKCMFHYLENQAWSYGAMLCLEKLLKHEKIQIIEYPETNAEGYYASNISTIKSVCRLHITGLTESASNLSRNFISRKKTFLMEKKSVLRAQRITCPSHALAEYTVQCMGIDKSRIAVFPNPIDSLFINTTVGPKESFDYRLLYVGRIERRKGVEILLSAFINLLNHYPQTKLRLIGQDYGYYYDHVRKVDRLREMINNYGVTDKIEFLPRQERDKLIEHFAWADVVVVPSLNENLPYVVIEAMSQARPVIASDCGGIPEIIVDGKTGFLFPTADISGLTATLLHLWEHPELAKVVGTSAQEKVRNKYSADIIIPQIEKTYMEALSC